ncbi:MAG: hypothetical protein Q4D76_17225 [Oscillospiraceae bacterium]|nr:hypothetical protein [Oscillospiraceae bacterium]
MEKSMIEGIDKIIFNFNEDNLEFISKPFDYSNNQNGKEYTMVQINSPCIVKPSVSSMKKTVKSLLD